MSVWRRTRTEVAGAWRSVRYDMGRRPSEPPADGPDVTSTGMNTFTGAAWDCGPEPVDMPVAGRMPEPKRGSARRSVAVSAFGVMTVVGAAGAYLVAVNGLVPLRDAGPAAAGTVPPATTAESGIGRSPRTPGKPVIDPARPPEPTVPTGRYTRKAQEPAPRPPQKVSPIRTTKPTNLICCANPPAPTPTAPTTSPSPTPSASPAPSTSASNSGNPGESPEPRQSVQPGHRRRHH
jgi:hypothetical protein